MRSVYRFHCPIGVPRRSIELWRGAQPWHRISLKLVLTSALTLTMLGAPEVVAQQKPQDPVEPLRFAKNEVYPDLYLVHLDATPAVRRSGLADAIAVHTEAQWLERQQGASGAPLLTTPMLRRALVSSPAYMSAQVASRSAVEHSRLQLSSYLGRELVAQQRYSVLITGFTTQLEHSEVDQLRSAPGVLSVEPVPVRRPTSDVSAGFVGAPDVWTGVATGVPARGAGVLVGIMDSGVERLHPSFADVPGISNPYGSGNFVGLCESTPALCNDKLVGLWFCDGTFSEPGDPPCSDAPPVPADPTDDTGHGSHVASIAIGNEVDAGYDISNPLPSISGIAPLASVISYDVCESNVCPGLLEGLERAMSDGVDVINISILGPQSPWTAPDAIAARELAAAGVVVVASAGNDGAPTEVTWQAPWITTVGSSSHTRDRYQATLTPIDGDEGTRPAPMQVVTVGAEVGIPTPTELVYDGGTCGPPMGTYSGEAVACEAGGTFPLNVPTYKADAVRDAGGSAVVALFPTTVPAALPGVIPFARVTSHADGTALRDWLQAPRGASAPPKVAISAGTLITSPSFGDVVSNFSSRGPVQDFDLLKPDLVAPGHFILAADYADGHFGEPPADVHVQRRQGTSMASPQVAGAAALLLELNPALTPAQVRSILQTTAQHSGLSSCEAPSVIFPFPCSPPAVTADFFDYGAGRLAVTASAQAGLALNETDANFLAANPATGGNPTTLNVASIAQRDCPGGCGFLRTVGSLASSAVTWSANFTSPGGDPPAPPADLEWHAVPASFDLAPAGDQRVAIGVYATDASVVDSWAQALLELTPSDGSLTTARLPIAVMPSSFGADTDLAVTVSATTAEFLPGDEVEFEVVLTNLGTVAAVGATVTVPEPADVTMTSWTCSTTGSSVCATSMGAGSIAGTVAIFPGDEVTYIVSIGDTSAVAATEMELSASVSPPAGLVDLVGANDAATGQSLNAAHYLIFADGFESGDTLAWQ